MPVRAIPRRKIHINYFKHNKEFDIGIIPKRIYQDGGSRKRKQYLHRRARQKNQSYQILQNKATTQMPHFHSQSLQIRLKAENEG